MSPLQVTHGERGSDRILRGVEVHFRNWFLMGKTFEVIKRIIERCITLLLLRPVRTITIILVAIANKFHFRL